MNNKLITAILACMVAAPFTSVGWSEDIAPETKAAVKSAITAHIDAESSQGVLVVKDAAKGEKKLTFDYVHEGVGRKANGYVACVDFTDADGNAYDVDFLVSDKAGELEVVDVYIHKAKGKKK